MRSSILASCLVAFAMTEAAPGACLQDDYSVEAEYVRSVAVVQVKVISDHTVPDPQAQEFIGGTIYAVRIQESFRGALSQTIEVFSENSTGRFPMEKGKSYLLFLYREDGRQSADPCGNSGLKSERKNVLVTLRALQKAKHSDQKPNTAGANADCLSSFAQAMKCDSHFCIAALAASRRGSALDRQVAGSASCSSVQRSEARGCSGFSSES